MIVPDDDEYEVIQPRPPVPQERPKPLPRLWKHDQNPEDAPPPEPGTPPLASGANPPGTRRPAAPSEPRPETPRRPATGERPRAPRPAEPEQRPRPAPRDRAQPRGETPQRVLVEETPEFDTYDARRRVRTTITLLMLAGAVTAIVMLVLPALNSGEENFENLPDEGVLAKSAEAKKPKPDAAEGEARNMLNNARVLARNGKPNDAAGLLKRLTASYPTTKAAVEAREALARPAQNPPLPLFLDDKTGNVVASAPEARPVPGEAAPPVVVDASTPRPAAPGTADASLTLPRNPAEPPRGPMPGATVAGSEPKQLPPGFSVREGAGTHPSGWPLQITSDRDGSPMIFVPPGAFRQGRDDGASNEAPSHLVNLGAYYIDEHEVTIRQYELYLKETGRRSALPARKPGGKADEVERPVGGLSARDAVDFLEWTGKKLPTEAQWEKAARGTDGRIYPWGNAEPTWSRTRQSKQIDPIVTYELDRTPSGIYDMAGNAWEWTADYYDPNYYRQFQDGTAVNPVGPAPKGRAAQLVVKGGSRTFHVTWREGLPPETRYPFLGFRGVLAVEAGAPSPAVAGPAVTSPAPAPVPTAAPSSGAGARPAAPAGTRPATKPAAPGGVVPF